MTPETERACFKIHFIYIVAILVVIIIGLLSVRGGTNESLTNTLNFALGLTSMVLAILAIIYAFFANNTFSATVSKLETASTSIKQDSIQLKTDLNILQTSVREIFPTIQTIEGRTQEILVASQQPKSEQKPVPLPDNRVIIDFVNTVITEFLRNSSFNGLKILYVCRECCIKKIEFDLRALCAADGSMSYDYAYGFLIATTSARFVTCNINDDGAKTSVSQQQCLLIWQIQLMWLSRTG